MVGFNVFVLSILQVLLVFVVINGRFCGMLVCWLVLVLILLSCLFGLNSFGNCLWCIVSVCYFQLCGVVQCRCLQLNGRQVMQYFIELMKWLVRWWLRKLESSNILLVFVVIFGCFWVIQLILVWVWKCFIVFLVLISLNSQFYGFLMCLWIFVWCWLSQRIVGCNGLFLVLMWIIVLCWVVSDILWMSL